MTDDGKPRKAVFYDMIHSNNGARIRLWLNLKQGLEAEIETRMLTYPELKGEEFAAVNPLKKIPGLIRSDGVVVFESFVILEYLEDKYSHLQPSFKPATPEGRQHMNLLIRCHDLYVASPNCTAPGFSHSQGAMYLSYGWHGADRGMDLPTRAAKLAEIWKQLTFLNDQIVGPYLVGENVSLADFTWYPTTIFMEFMLPRVFGWPDIFRDEGNHLPKLAKWWMKLTDEPAFAKVREQIFDYWVGMEEKGQFAPIVDEIKNDTTSLKFKYP